MIKPVFVILILALFTRCASIEQKDTTKSKDTFEQIVHIKDLGSPIKLEYFQKSQDSIQTFPDTATFVITNPEELKSALDQIKSADNPEMWKGVGWSKISIHFNDTILNLSTDGIRIGQGSSGKFYELEKENFITERVDQQ
jgi:hypothetical protein